MSTLAAGRVSRRVLEKQGRVDPLSIHATAGKVLSSSAVHWFMVEECKSLRARVAVRECGTGRSVSDTSLLFDGNVMTI